jgi:hypothetical protein
MRRVWGVVHANFGNRGVSGFHAENTGHAEGAVQHLKQAIAIVRTLMCSERSLFCRYSVFIGAYHHFLAASLVSTFFRNLWFSHNPADFE